MNNNPSGKSKDGYRGGRPKGAVGKLTRTVKERFQAAFEELQKDDQKPWHLANWAKENPTDFYKLANKMVPQGVEMSGVDGEPIQVVVEKIANDSTPQ